MRRRLIKLAVFLLLGAIVNVAVAWGVALWSIIDERQSVQDQAVEAIAAEAQTRCPFGIDLSSFSISFASPYRSTGGRFWFICFASNSWFINRHEFGYY